MAIPLKAETGSSRDLQEIFFNILHKKVIQCFHESCHRGLVAIYVADLLLEISIS